MSILDSRKRSAEDADCCDAIVAPTKKGSKVESAATRQPASPQENFVPKGSNSNSTIASASATTVSSTPSALRASGVGVVIDEELA